MIFFRLLVPTTVLVHTGAESLKDKHSIVFHTKTIAHLENDV